MSRRILFIGALHHPQRLVEDRAANPDNPPLFPVHYGYHFYEKEFKKRGYALDVFWRNLPRFDDSTLEKAGAYRYSEGLSPQRIAQALMRRFPARVNPGYRQRNALLLAQAERFKPDIIWMIGDNFIIYPETLEALKQRHNAKIIYASGTSPIVFSHSLERAAARLYDLVLVNDYYHGVQWLELGAKRMCCLPVTAAIDPDVHFPHKLSEAEQQHLASDIAFVGTLLPENLYSERIAALEAISEFNPGIWTVHDAPASLQPFVRGSALGEEMLRILSAAKMTLNTHGDFMRYGGNMRLFEAAGAGVFQLVDARDGIETWFKDGEHVVIYHNHDDLREKGAYYLENAAERERIATAAREHALTHHTFAHRVDALESLIADWS